MRIITFVLLACALATTAHAQQPAQIRGFSVVLLLGEQQGSVPSEGLSPSALRAIADIKEFLPYKGYRVLDTQWVAGSVPGSIKGRITGLDNFGFDFQVDTWPGGVKFRLGAGSSNTLLENSFAIKPGETVVVGTSRVVASRPQPDSAMIVLLTAVAAGK
jgi:opacity protein-like surface antigen